jgi:signal transduction histidine kinase
MLSPRSELLCAPIRMRKLVIFAVAVGLLVLLGTLRWNDIRASRAEALQTATGRASSLALVLAQYLEGTFAAGDAALRQLALHSRRIGGPAGPASEWVPILTSARAGLNGIGAISVVDSSLVIRHSTRPDIVGQNRQGDPYIAATLMEEGDNLFVGSPFKSPAVNRYLIPIGRRLTDSADKVEGAVIASFLPQELRAFFQSLNVGRDGRVWIFHTAGQILIEEPSPVDPMGQPASTNAVFAEAVRSTAPSGTVDAALEPDGPRMVSAYRRVADLPLVVAVSLDVNEVLIPYRREVRAFVANFSVISVVVFGVLFLFTRQLERNAAAEAELQRARQVEAERLRDLNEQLSVMLQREQAARREAEEASALKDQFVMTVSHELRTPLTAIAGWARMLVDGMVSEDKRESALRTIERNAQAQKRLIEDLLDIAGIMAGKLRLDIRPIAVAEVIHNAVDAVMPAATAKGINLETSVDPQAGTVSADPERLQQIVWNLLSNAVKFTPQGGRVSVAVRRTAGELQITVADTGAGIHPDLLPHVFERFRQGAAGAARRHGGLGLGLAIVRNLVELHGGTVTAHSDGEGRGATFHVAIPAAA